MNSVLIAGAGPTGLTLAIELARFGIPVRIVDKAPERTTKSKALVVWTRTLELLERSGCAERFLTLGNPVTAASIFAGKKRVGRITFDDVVSPYPFALMIPQSETERILENHLNFLGVHVERGVALADFASIDSKVTATLVHPNDRREVHIAPYLVGCDGAHSFVRDRLGIDFAGDTMPSDWILADVHLTGVTTPASELDLIWHEDGVFALFPMAENRYRVIADVGLAHAGVPRPNPTLAEVQAIVDRRGPGGIRVSDPKWLASFRINERKVAAYRFGRVFLAGDAAHIHSPAGGQGMNTGMQDAINLAWKLALVARDACAPEPLLASYSAERSAVGKQLLAATGTLTAVAVTKNPVARYFRNHAAEILFGLASAREKNSGGAHGSLDRLPAQPVESRDRSASGPASRKSRAAARERDRNRFRRHSALRDLRVTERQHARAPVRSRESDRTRTARADRWKRNNARSPRRLRGANGTCGRVACGRDVSRGASRVAANFAEPMRSYLLALSTLA